MAFALDRPTAPAAWPAIGGGAGPESSGLGLGIESATLLLPADGTAGGDFVDRVSLDDQRECFVVGDVCGKGAAAAGHAEVARRAIHDSLAAGAAPADALEDANRVLASENELDAATGRFTSAVVAQVTAGPRRATVDFASAGHPPAVVVREAGTIQRLRSTGMVLGVAGRVSVGERRVHLGPGDALLLYSDGATDIRSGREVFGIERLVGLARGCRGMGAVAIASTVHRAVLDFQHGVHGDDFAITVVSLPLLA